VLLAGAGKVTDHVLSLERSPREQALQRRDLIDDRRGPFGLFDIRGGNGIDHFHLRGARNFAAAEARDLILRTQPADAAFALFGDALVVKREFRGRSTSSASTSSIR
jgi:hypothetical protein